MQSSAKNIIGGQILNNLALDLLEIAKNKGFKNLTPLDIKMLRKPVKFVGSVSLDDKLRIAHKLGKQVAIVIVDENGLDGHNFSKIFKQTFSSNEQNEEAIELIDGAGLVVLGDETVGRHLQRTEMFMNTDLFEVSKVMKRIKNRKVGVENHHFDNKQHDLKELFFNTVVRMFFAACNMDDYLETMGLTKREFAILCILWLSQKPMTNDTISQKMNLMIGTKIMDIRSQLKHLQIKNFVKGVSKEISHKYGRKYLFMLSHLGKECIDNFVKRVTEQTMTTLYE